MARRFIGEKSIQQLVPEGRTLSFCVNVDIRSVIHCGRFTSLYTAVHRLYTALHQLYTALRQLYTAVHQLYTALHQLYTALH